MFEWISNLIEKGGYLGIIFLTFLENVFPPIPSELIMPFAGHLAQQGEFNFFLVIVSGAIGSTLGAIPLYFAGKILGAERIKTWADNYGHWLALDKDDIEKSQKWFVKHRNASAFWGRLVPGVRSLIAIPAGINNAPLPPFLALTFAGSFIWMGVLTTAGYFLGSAFKKVDAFLGPVTYIVVGGLVLAFIWRGWRKHQHKHG